MTMPPVRNGQYINIDDRSANPLHITTNQVIETKISMHNHLPPQHSPSPATSMPSQTAKPSSQYGSPSIQHQPSGSQSAIQQTPLTKAELRKVTTITEVQINITLQIQFYQTFFEFFLFYRSYGIVRSKSLFL